MVLLRLPQAQAASFPPSLSPGTGRAWLQPWKLCLLLQFFFFETSLCDSMKCPCTPSPGLAKLTLGREHWAWSPGSGLLPWMPFVTWERLFPLAALSFPICKTEWEGGGEGASSHRSRMKAFALSQA